MKEKFSLTHILLVLLGFAMSIIQCLSVSMESARFAVEARSDFASSLAVLGGFAVIIPLGLGTASDFTSLAILLVLEFARVGAVLQRHLVGFQFGFVLAEDLTLGAVMPSALVSHALKVVLPHGVRTLQSKITEFASVRFGDTGKAVILTAFGFFTGFDFGFFDSLFLLPHLKLTVLFVHLAVVLTEVAVDPALISSSELGDFVAVLIHRVGSHLRPVCLDFG